jgi:hypothetical protein
VATGRRRSLLSIVAGYLGISALLGWDALRWERRSDGMTLEARERFWRALRISLFNGLWLLVVPKALLDLALRRGPIQYVKMDHDGAGGPAASSDAAQSAASAAAPSSGRKTGRVRRPRSTPDKRQISGDP